MAIWPIFCVARSLRIDLRYARRSCLENRTNRRRRYASHLRDDALVDWNRRLRLYAGCGEIYLPDRRGADCRRRRDLAFPRLIRLVW
jgi:hypothetical protein